MRIEIYTDGACSGNPGPGGWSAIIHSNEKVDKIHGSSLNTTNNRMELKAVIECLKFCKNKECKSIYIYSDSAYVLNPINNKWLKKWIERGWKTSKEEEVKNKDLWIDFIDTYREVKNKNKKIRFIKVKGHSGNEMNNVADALAKKSIPAL